MLDSTNSYRQEFLKGAAHSGRESIRYSPIRRRLGTEATSPDESFRRTGRKKGGWQAETRHDMRKICEPKLVQLPSSIRRTA
ncbi:hypothetical protein CPB85DRAFT_1341819 [Mucidula mucida]|nr:hypothetical protein CPB85DRAFT_1341819 [Mucidula mucida]